MGISDVVGGYLIFWLISMGSAIGMLFACLIVAEIAEESVVTLFVLVYNGAFGIFILLSMAPVGVFIVLFGLLYNGFAPIMVPLVQTAMDLLVPIFSSLFVVIGLLPEIITAVPVAPATIDMVEAMDAFISLIFAFGQFLLQETGLPTNVTFEGVVAGTTALLPLARIRG